MPYRHGVRAKQRMGIINVGKYINMEEILFHRIWKEQLIILKRHMIEVIRRKDIKNWMEKNAQRYNDESYESYSEVISEHTEKSLFEKIKKLFS